MRIPIYRSGSAPTSEAPGRSFSARKSAQPFVQAEMQKGAVASELFGQANEFAQMRYKAAREVQVQQKILAGEDTLRRTAEELENINTNKLGSVFNDGGKPEEALWNQSIEKARSELLADVRDKEARRALTQRFNQMEMTQRYSLRGRIDQKIQAANNAARAANARQTADFIASGSDIAATQLKLKNFGVDSVRLGKFGIGNPNALKAQERAVVFDGALGAVRNHVFGQESRYTAAENLRKALRENDPSLAGEGQYAFAVLSMLPVKDQAKILDSVGSTAKFIDAPTLEEKKQQTIINATADDIGGRVDVAVKALEKGMDIPLEDISMINDQANQIVGSLDGERSSKLSQKVTDLNAFNQLKTDLNQLASPEDVAKVVADAQSGAFSGEPGSVDTEMDIKLAKFASNYQSNMIKMLQEDPMAFVEQAKAVSVPEVNLSPDAFASGETGIAARRSAATQASAIYGTKVPLLTNQQAQSVVQMVQEDVLAGSAILGLLTTEAGEYSQSVIDQLSEQGLQPALVQAMYTNDPALQRRLADVANVSLSELKSRIDSFAAPKSFEAMEQILASETEQLRTAYFLGGGTNAQDQWVEQSDVAKKLASVYVLNNGMDPKLAAQRAAKEIFPAKDSVFSTSKGTYFIPDRADAAKISSAASLILMDDTLFEFEPIQPLPTQYPEFVGEELNRASIVSSGRWVTNSDSTGLVLHYRMSGDALLPVFREDGTEFNLTFDEIADLGRKVSDSKFAGAKEIGSMSYEQGYSLLGEQMARDALKEAAGE